MHNRLLPMFALLASGCATTPLPPADHLLQADLAAAGAELETVASGLGDALTRPGPEASAAYGRARAAADAAVRRADARVSAASSAAARRVAREIAEAAAACSNAIALVEARHRDPGLTRGLFHLSAVAETCAIARETDRLLGRSGDAG